MTSFTLATNCASYIHIAQGKVTINSPITTEKGFKGKIGISLDGLRKPTERTFIQFVPAADLTAGRLEWTSTGPILYIQVLKGHQLTKGKTIGMLTTTPYIQNAKYNQHTNPLRFTN